MIFRKKIITYENLVLILSISAAIAATIYFYSRDLIIAYGDAESHLNIAKRVISGLTPGMAQLGGIWLPLPHLILVPFVANNFLWRTGLAGSIVSGTAFVLSTFFLYKLTLLLTSSQSTAFWTALIFLTNPNLLYLQSTPLTELFLIAFFILNTYFLSKFILNQDEIVSLILAAFFGFCSTLSRYDGWFLVALETGLIFLHSWWQKAKDRRQGRVILFATPAFYGIILWLGWNFLIFGNPLYFNTSVFSARAQQLAWKARGELPAYFNLPVAFIYYLVTVLNNAGIIFFLTAGLGLLFYLFDRKRSFSRWLIALILLSPFAFNVISLFLGQSVIFIPSLTPASFEWRLFNVRYGVMMMPAVAFWAAYFIKKLGKLKLPFAVSLLILNSAAFGTGFFRVISLDDGVFGLSAAKKVDAQNWLKQNYDGGLVLLDDYARTLSVIRANIPMNRLIYIGTKPYWQESLIFPEKYSRWLVMQKGDEVWNNLYENPEKLARVYKYFNKVYTSEEILIFKRIDH